MRTHFKNLATAVVLYIVVLAKSCSKENIVISPTKDKGGGPQLMQHKFASPAKALEGDDSILDDGTAMETADDYSEEEQQDNPDTVLQKNNNLLRRRKPNNRGSCLPSHSSKNPNSGQEKEKKDLMESLEKKATEIMQLQERQKVTLKDRIKESREIKRKLKSGGNLVVQKNVVKDFIEQLEDSEKKLKEVIKRGDEILEKVKGLRKQMLTFNNRINKVQNKLQECKKDLEEVEKEYVKLRMGVENEYKESVGGF